MRRISTYDRIGWCAIALIVVMLAPSYPYAAFALIVSVVAIRIGVKVDQRAIQRRRLAADATVQHQAILAGSDDIGVYGRYPPPATPGGEVVVPATPWVNKAPPPPLTATTMTDEPWVDPCRYREVGKPLTGYEKLAAQAHDSGDPNSEEMMLARRARRDRMRIAFEKALEQHAEAFDKLADL
jgi:hypothetical protein